MKTTEIRHIFTLDMTLSLRPKYLFLKCFSMLLSPNCVMSAAMDFFSFNYVLQCFPVHAMCKFILLGNFFFFFFILYLPYLSSIHEKAMYRYVLDGKSALAWELLFPGHLSST